jgi:hypothetical protein
VPPDILGKTDHSVPVEHSGEGEPSTLHLPASLNELRLTALGTTLTTSQLTRY